MKLLSYHIENYGKLQNIDGTFEDGLTCICEENGSGKTTLASFIKAMFYGLPTYTAASKGFNDRQRFYPFNGGKFGGNLTFEAGGKTYKIERFFDKKSSKNDELRVFLGGAPYLGFGETIGKDLFGLDEESFQKTVFITADEIEIGSTHSINEKLNGTVQGEDEGNFKAAIEALDTAKKELKAARGSNDKISRIKAEIVNLTHEIHNLQSMSDSLREEYVERERLTKEIAALEVQVREASGLALVLQKWETLDSMIAQAEEKRKSLLALTEKYPNGLPEEAERKRLHGYAQEETQIQGGLQITAFGEEKESALQELSTRFASGIPSQEELQQTQDRIARLGILQAELSEKQAEIPHKQRLLASKFSLGIPSETEFLEKRALIEEYKRKNNELRGVSTAMAQSAQEKPPMRKPNKSSALLWLLAVILLGAGIALLFVEKIAGIACIAAAVISAVIAVITRVKGGVNADMPAENVNLKLISLQAELRTLEEKIRAFTVPYGYYDEAGILYDFNTLEEDVRAYQAYLAETAQAELHRQEKTCQAQALQGEIEAFLAKHGEESADLQAGLTRLIGAVQALRTLQEDKRIFTEKSQLNLARLQALKQGRQAILEKYQLPVFAGTMDGLNTLNMDANAWNTLSQELRGLLQNVEEYKDKNQLSERPTCANMDTDALHASLSLDRKELADCYKRIEETERYVETLPDVENRLALSEEKLKEYQERHALLTDTIDTLKAAEQALKDKYIAPIKERFCGYATALSRIFGEKIGMDQDFHIVFERGGEERSERHLSAGERSLCALCLRLALIDNLYEDEPPFVVMDDPFVHLDAKHMAKTGELLLELSKGKQIVYFCCHESRRAPSLKA